VQSYHPLHHLTGCDSTSKFGTKTAGLKANPEKYLQNFARNPYDTDFNIVEEFLVHVYQSKVPSDRQTMYHLRYHLPVPKQSLTFHQLVDWPGTIFRGLFSGPTCRYTLWIIHKLIPRTLASMNRMAYSAQREIEFCFQMISQCHARVQEPRVDHHAECNQ